MPESKGNIFSLLFRWLARLFGGGKGNQEQPVPKPDNPEEPAQITTNKVLAIVYNPIVDILTGEKMIEKQSWHRPEDLATGFMADILQHSHGMARYQVVERVDVDAFPEKTDGFQYTPQEFMNVLRGVAPPYMPQEANYHTILNQFSILNRVANNEIDEVWLFGPPHAGFYESVMAGPGAFWCNAPPLTGTAQAQRRFVIMGFNYERGVGEMLESFGHRVESIMDETFKRLGGEANLWKRFTRYEKIAPGKAALGTIHFAPNSERDYDWNNPRFVNSECDDWLHSFPNFPGNIRQVNADEWGNGDIRLHHQWWLKHIPHVAGRKNGIHHNWWQYILKPQNVS
ncbi:MAG: hypothetical protein Kow002_06250 [Anaerolineales bacterium]